MPMATDVSRPASVPTDTGTGNAPPERAHHKGRKPFSAIMKRLANFKSSSGNASAGTTSGGNHRSASFSGGGSISASHKVSENSVPLSRASSGGHLSFALNANHPPFHSSGDSESYSAPQSAISTSTTSSGGVDEDDGLLKEASSVKSRPAPSATTATTSAFSSPTPSVRSLSTTLTTIQSTAPGSLLNSNYNPHPSHHHNPNAPPQMYSSQFPTSATPAQSPGLPHGYSSSSAAGLLHPVNYNTATANGILTDNASIITLASSSKRRRRSMDTDASVRALAPSSVFGGSRESLPLSVLSGNFDSVGARSVAGERGSLYGAASIHNRAVGAGNDAASTREQPAAGASSPLVSPTTPGVGRASRRSSGWGGARDGEDDEVADARSFSARSASVRGFGEESMLGGEAASVADGSSNVGVWHGVIGKSEGPHMVGHAHAEEAEDELGDEEGNDAEEEEKKLESVCSEKTVEESKPDEVKHEPEKVVNEKGVNEKTD